MATVPQQQNAAPRGRGQGKRGNNQRRPGGRGRGRAGSVDGASTVTAVVMNDTTSQEVEPAADDDDEEVCWICAEKIKFYGFGECNHLTCHVCALRLRALYKKTECAFCKAAQPLVIFSTTSTNLFQSYDTQTMAFSDAKLAIYFETKEMMEESLILLRFNCPDPDCDYIATGGWADLKWHVRDSHKKLMCDLCIRTKKIFTHEHTTYTQQQLSIHLPSMSKNPNAKGGKGKEDVESHPMCEFCRECFYSDDELYAHFREKHEECFICKKAGMLHQYFLNWNKLEEHFIHQHFRCMESSCLEQKFVVFPTQLDLQAHRVDVHGDSMTSKDKKGARRIDVGFTAQSYEDPNSRRAAGSGAHSNRARAGGGGPSTAPPDPPPPRPGPVHAPIPRPVVGSSRRANFGAELTSDAPSDGRPVRNLPTPSQHSLPRTDVDPDVLAQHENFLDFVQSLTTSPNGLTAIRSAVKSWRGSESTVYDMLDTIYNVLERNMDKTSRVVTRLAELLEAERRTELLDSFGGMKAERGRQFPTLTPLASGTMDYAGVSSGLVLNAKHSTRARGRGRDLSMNSPIWERVEQAASSSSAPDPFAGPSRSIQPRVVPGSTAPAPTTNFPTLSSKSGNAAGPRLGSVWTGPSASSSNTVRAPQMPMIRSVNMAGSPPTKKGKSSAPTVVSAAAFPGLPKARNDELDEVMSANEQWRNITGPKPVPVASAWGSAAQRGARPTAQASSARSTPTASSNNNSNNAGGAKGKGKKGKEKLFTFGSALPT